MLGRGRWVGWNNLDKASDRLRVHVFLFSMILVHLAALEDSFLLVVLLLGKEQWTL